MQRVMQCVMQRVVQCVMKCVMQRVKQRVIATRRAMCHATCRAAEAAWSSERVGAHTNSGCAHTHLRRITHAQTHRRRRTRTYMPLGRGTDTRGTVSTLAGLCETRYDLDLLSGALVESPVGPAVDVEFPVIRPGDGRTRACAPRARVLHRFGAGAGASGR